VYDTNRPWKLDDTVAWAALKNPAAAGFNLVHDMYNKPWAVQRQLESATGDNYKPPVEVAFGDDVLDSIRRSSEHGDDLPPFPGPT
jgi:hypothetical protein